MLCLSRRGLRTCSNFVQRNAKCLASFGRLKVLPLHIRAMLALLITLDGMQSLAL